MIPLGCDGVLLAQVSRRSRALCSSLDCHTRHKPNSLCLVSYAAADLLLIMPEIWIPTCTAGVPHKLKIALPIAMESGFPTCVFADDIIACSVSNWLNSIYDEEAYDIETKLFATSSCAYFMPFELINY